MPTLDTCYKALTEDTRSMVGTLPISLDAGLSAASFQHRKKTFMRPYSGFNEAALPSAEKMQIYHWTSSIS